MTIHTVKSYEQELEQLSILIARMGGLAESQLAAGMEAAAKGDAELAHRTVAGDRRIDELERAIGDEAVRLIALRQPMALDLREAICAIKISADLERIGDYAANVAKRARAFDGTPPARSMRGLARLGGLALTQLKAVLDAYTERDADAALAVWRRDEDLDDLYNSLFRELLTYMMEDPRTITLCTHLLFMAKNVERIGDHCTNIAETIYYLVHGDRIAEARPKGEDGIGAGARR